MTDRQRAAASVYAVARQRIEREAEANGESISQATDGAIRVAVDDAASNSAQAHAGNWNAGRFCREVERAVRTYCDGRS